MAPSISIYITTMLIEITENTFEPGGKKTPDIYRKGEVKDLADEAASELIERGVARPVTEEEAEEKKSKKKGKKEEPEA